MVLQQKSTYIFKDLKIIKKIKYNSIFSLNKKSEKESDFEI